MATDTIPQKRQLTLRCIAEAGPCSISQVSRTLRRDYKNVHSDVAILQRLGYVNRLGFTSGESRQMGNKRPSRDLITGFWITPKGLVEAVDVGAKPGRLIERASQVFPDPENRGRLLVEGICRFAIEQGPAWDETTSRENLIRLLVEELGPVWKEMAKARRNGRKIGFISIDLGELPSSSPQTEKVKPPGK